MAERIEYKIKIGNPPDNEQLTIMVTLSVIRLRIGDDGMVIKGEKVRDPETIKAWSLRAAIRKATARGQVIVNEDQAARGARPTTVLHYRK